jgi:hypothetical protein
MQLIINILIFLIIFIIYLQIINHTTIQKFENIYESDFLNNNNLQSTCSLYKPFIFDYNFNSPNNIISRITNNKLFKINIYQSNDSKKIKTIPYKKSCKLFYTGENKYYTFKNNTNIVNSDLNSLFIAFNKDLKPHFNCQTNYDLITGNKYSITPIINHNFYSAFFYVLKGNAKFKLINYDIQNKYNYDLKDIWNKKNNCSVVNATLNSNKILFLPPKHFTSIKFLTSDTIVLVFYYNTIISASCNIFNKVLNDSILNN